MTPAKLARWLAIVSLAALACCRAVLGIDDLRVDPSCLDGLWNHAETDVDCGGPSCAPCDKGKACSAPSDCRSGFCPDGRCCESACDRVCEACSEVKTGAANGLCVAIAAGADPDDECRGPESCEAEACSGLAGACEIAEAGTVCRPAAASCDAVESCDGRTAGCPADARRPPGTVPAEACPPGAICDGGPSCASQHLWSERFGSGANGEAVAVDAEGNVILVGYFYGTVDFGGGALASAGFTDIFLAKLDPSGNHLWSQHFGGPEFQDLVGAGAAVDASGNVILTGSFSGTADFGGGAMTSIGWRDVVVAKFDPAGNHLWSGHFGGASGSASGNALAVDAGGNVVLTGRFNDTIDFGGNGLTSAGQHDAFVAKLDSDGNHLWSKRLGGPERDEARGLAVDASGNVVVTGQFEGTVDFGGVSLTSAGSRDIFVAKLDSAGNFAWSRGFGDFASDGGRAVSLDSDDNLVVTGRFEETVDFGGGPLTSAEGTDAFLAKLDSEGNHLWSRDYGGASGFAHGVAVAVDATDNIAVLGGFNGTVDFGGGSFTATSEAIFLARLGPAGNHLWSLHFGGSDSNGGEVSALAADPAGNLVLTGNFSGTVDFGGGLVTSAGGSDVFAAKYAP